MNDDEMKDEKLVRVSEHVMGVAEGRNDAERYHQKMMDGIVWAVKNDKLAAMTCKTVDGKPATALVVFEDDKEGVKIHVVARLFDSDDETYSTLVPADDDLQLVDKRARH